MSTTPIRTLEAAFVANVFTEAVIPELSFVKESGTLQVYPGIHFDEKALPRVQVAALDIDPAPGFEGIPEAREYMGTLYVACLCSAQGADAARRTSFDQMVAAIADLFEGGRSDTSIKELLNYPAEGEDTRTVPALHIYQVHVGQHSQDPLERGVWQHLLHYRLEFAAHDGVVLEE